jgi:phospholipase C
MGIEEIKHVVILMQENRSFDEYFGTFPGVSGFSDDSPLFGNPWPGSNLFPFRLSTFTAAAEQLAGCRHDWTGMHAAFNGGQMNGWNNNNNPIAVLGYYVADDIPYHWALAQTFALCDHYFASVLSSTASNRLYLMSGCVVDPGSGAVPQGQWPGPAIGIPPLTATPSNPTPPFPQGLLSWQSYADMITQANMPGISWKVYDETVSTVPWLSSPLPNYAWNGWGSLNVLDLFGSDQGSPNFRLGYGQFESDIEAGHLPTVSWICQPFGVTEWHQNHPADGAYYISQKLNAILTGADNDNGGVPFWNNTVFILTYDESDSQFDHVTPPVPPFPGTGVEKWLDAGDGLGPQPIGAGFRVPAIIISPWTVGVGIQSDLLDHTSILQFLERVTNVQSANLPAGGFRRQTFGDLTTVFNFANAVGAAEVMSVLPSVGTVLQWKNNAYARLMGQTAALIPPNPQPSWPPPTQSCVANSPSLAVEDVIAEAGEAPQPGPPGSATMENALIVNVIGFEADEFVDTNAGAPPWVPQSEQIPPAPQISVQGGQCDTRVPSVTVIDGGSPGEFSFGCTLVSADPNSLLAAAQSGVAVQITFWISVTFNSPITTFAFRRGTVRILELLVSFTVDTTVTCEARIELSGGTLVVVPFGACAQLAEQMSEAEQALLRAQRELQGPGSPEEIEALERTLGELQSQYSKYCGSGGPSGPSGPSGSRVPVRIGGG